MLPIVFLDKKYVSIGSRMGGPQLKNSHCQRKYVPLYSTSQSSPSLSAELPSNHVLREILAAIAERSHR